MESKHRNKIKIVIGLIVAIILLFILVCCSRRGEDDYYPAPPLTDEQYILRIMKQDEAVLVSLYQMSDICSETWIDDFFRLADRFMNYRNMYEGSDLEILALIAMFEEYSYKLRNIIMFIYDGNFEEGILQLEELREFASQVEAELDRLYRIHFVY